MAEDEAKTPLEMEARGEKHRDEELERRSWDKRPDGMVLDKEEKVCYLLECKRALERFGGAQEQARQKAERQHDNLVRGLSKTLKGGERRVTLIVFVGGMRGSVEEKFSMRTLN